MKCKSVILPEIKGQGQDKQAAKTSLPKQIQPPFYQQFQLLNSSEYILIGAGAGFSVDSGLKVYKDIAKIPTYKTMNLDYADLCDPSLLIGKESQQIFYGFWGTCYNDYKQTQPHKGYHQLLNILEKLNKKYFVYTSNVDGFFKRVFPEDNVFEIHGTLMEWQCSKLCSDFVYCFDEDFRFDISPDMRFMFQNQLIEYYQESSSMVETEDVGSKYKLDPNFMVTLKLKQNCMPICHLCRSPLRPRVLMFDDDKFMENEAEAEQFAVFSKEMMKSKSLLLLEFGCGLRVPTIRENFERWLRIRLKKGKLAQLVRVNPGEEKLGVKTRAWAGKVQHVKVGAEEFIKGLQ